MRPLDEESLKSIAAEYDIEYVPVETESANAIATQMSRVFKISRSELFAKIANLKDHTRLFSHLTAINVINSADVADVIGENQFVIVEGLAEGGSKLGVKLVTLTPEERIDCELMTDPFSTAISTRAADPKRGRISWVFEEVAPNTTKMTASSDFQVEAESAYVRGAIDHVWLDFFENVMIDTRELTPTRKRAAPFGPRGGLRAKELERLQELESENKRLRQVVADLFLEVQQMKDAHRKGG